MIINNLKFISPSDYRFEHDSIISSINEKLDWSELINDDVLDTLITHALINNQDLNIALKDYRS